MTQTQPTGNDHRQGRGGRGASILYGIAVILAFAATGYLLHTGSRSLELKDPVDLSSPESTVYQIEALKESYTAAIEEKADYRNLWSMVAIIAGSLGAAAVALRLPQPVIITLGAFLAMVYGFLELQKPQAVVGTLAKARGALICLQAQAVALAAVQQADSERIAPLAKALEPRTRQLEEHVIELEIRSRRLHDILAMDADQRMRAVAAVNDARLIPVQNYADGARTLAPLIEELNRRMETLSSRQRGRKNETDPPRIARRLSSMAFALENARDRLAAPGALQAELEEGLAAYTEQFVASEKTRVEATGQLDRAKSGLPRMQSALVSLKRWPADLEQAIASVNGAVARIHGHLLNEIAQAGPTVTDLKTVLAAISLPEQNPISPQGQSLTSAPANALAKSEEPVLRDAPLKTLEKDLAGLQIRTDELLNRLKPLMDEASAVSARLRQTIAKHLRVLEQARAVMAETTRPVIAVTHRFEGQLAAAFSELDKGEAILGTIDFDRMRSEVRRCVELGTQGGQRYPEAASAVPVP